MLEMRLILGRPSWYFGKDRIHSPRRKMTPEQEAKLIERFEVIDRLEKRFEAIEIRFDERDRSLEESKQLSQRLQNYALSLITAAVVSVIVTALTIIVRG